jgi:hypothetical protein
MTNRPVMSDRAIILFGVERNFLIVLVLDHESLAVELAFGKIWLFQFGSANIKENNLQLTLQIVIHHRDWFSARGDSWKGIKCFPFVSLVEKKSYLWQSLFERLLTHQGAFL